MNTHTLTHIFSRVFLKHFAPPIILYLKIVFEGFVDALSEAAQQPNPNFNTLRLNILLISEKNKKFSSYLLISPSILIFFQTRTEFKTQFKD